jgi:DNA mismatch repair protein MutH
MNDYDFSFQDLVQGYPLQSSLFVVLRTLQNEAEIHWKKNHTRESFKKMVDYNLKSH